MMTPHPTDFHRNMLRRLGLALIALAVGVSLLALLMAGMMPARAEGENSPVNQGEPILVKGWTSPYKDHTQSVAWGDVDGDGDLDLFAGNEGGPNRLYLNQGGRLAVASAEIFADRYEDATKSAATKSVAWGDVDGDGDLDLFAGNEGGPNRLYLNQDGRLAEASAYFFTNPDNDYTQSVAWGDVDGDGDLDLFIGNGKGPNRLYVNQGGRLIASADIFTDTNEYATTSVAWGDVDVDGDLDLFVGNQSSRSRLYLNKGGRLAEASTYFFINPSDDYTQSVAWGDVDGDGDLDLFIGNQTNHSRLYLNQGGRLIEASKDFFTGPDGVYTSSVAWGDVDSDGDLDLFVGNDFSLQGEKCHERNRLYLNQGGRLTEARPDVFKDPYEDATMSVAWGDVDGDGDLDLFAGNRSKPNRLYFNQGNRLTTASAEISTDPYVADTSSVAWGDVDGDGDLDLFAGNDGPNQMYLNQGGRLTASAEIFTDPYVADTSSVAWGDVDGDGDLDLFAGNWWSSNHLYLNQGGRLTASSDSFTDAGRYVTTSVAWGDVDGDGDLDLFAGNRNNRNRLYLNQGGRLTEASTDVFIDPYKDFTRSVAWGDVDGDGDLDLFAGNEGGPSRLYLNQGGQLAAASADFFRDSYDDYTRSVAWGDVDDDGDLDLFVGNDGSNRLYLNQGGRLAVASAEIFADPHEDDTRSVAWGDVDGDGDLDLFAGNREGPNRLYLNEGGRLRAASAAVFTDPYEDNTWSVAWGDVDGDGDLDLFAGNEGGSNRLYLNGRPVSPPFGPGGPAISIGLQGAPIATSVHTTSTQLAPAAFQAVSGVRQDIIPIRYTLLDPDAQPMRSIQAFYSLNGGDDWITTTLTNTLSSDLSTVSRQIEASHDAQPLADTGIVSATLFVTRAQPIVDLDVWLNLTHPHAADLEIALVSPAGKTVELIRATDSISGFVETVLDDQAEATLANGKAPFTGRYQPVGRLSDLDGDSTAGTWTLRIVDRQEGGAGRLLDWALHFSRTTPNRSEGAIHAPGDSQTVTSMIWVSTTSPLIDVDVLLNITDTLDGPGIELVSPAGITVTLVELARQAQFTNTLLSDQARYGLEQGASGFTGLFRPAERLVGFDGENPQGTWQLRMSGVAAVAGKALGNWALLLQTADGGQHICNWDVNKSGFFGQSDNVVFRVVAYPGQGASRNGIPGPFQRPFVSTQTYPFRVRGNQVQVYGETVTISNTLSGAVVYRLKAGKERGAEPLGGLDKPFRTSANGFLQGRAPIKVNPDSKKSDQLFALWPSAEVTEDMPTRGYIGLGTPMTVTAGSSVESRLVISDARRIAGLALWAEISETMPLTVVLLPPQGNPVRIISLTRPISVSQIFFEGETDASQAGCRAESGACNAVARDLARLYGSLADGTWTLQVTNPMTRPVRLQQWGLALQLSPLFYTSAKPTTTGLESHPVTAGGVLPLTVSSEKPLLLFDLNVALEWDASNDEQYMAQLSADLRRTSELLYDWSNGQAALGNVRVYHDARRNHLIEGTDAWNNAHIRIYATNRLRPNADQGGIISEVVTETVQITSSKVITYLPGQVRIGSVWNRYGEASTGNLGDDWSAALAHELGHYLLFLDDNYLGLDPQSNLIVPLDDDACPGAMNNPYSNVYSEFHPIQDWANSRCQETLSDQNTRRSDWQTITRFYPRLSAPVGSFESVMQGPGLLPLAVTQVTFQAPDPTSDFLAWLARVLNMTNVPIESLLQAVCQEGGRSVPDKPGTDTPSNFPLEIDCPTTTITSTAPLEVPIFYLKPAEGGGSYRVSSQARAFLFQGPPYSALVDLGQPNGDQIFARGARPTDRLCVYDLGNDRVGCKDIVPGDDQVKLYRNASGWEPQVIVSPVASRTLQVSLTLPLTDTNQVGVLLARLYPMDRPVLLPVTMTLASTNTQIVYTATIHITTTESPVLEGYVWVGTKEDDPSDPRKAVTEFAIGGNPVRIRALVAPTDPHNVRIRALVAPIRAQRVRIRAMLAPAASPDGQVLVYPDENVLNLDREWSFTLQPATRLPEELPWATPVGRAYWLATSETITDVGKSSITFEYRGSDVAPGEEPFLRLYFWETERTRPCDGRPAPCWRKLNSRPDLDNNLISALLQGDQGEGLYALMTSIEIPLQPGWNLIGYPVQTPELPTATRQVSEVLQSIAGNYAAIYSYDASNVADPWQVYGPAPETPAYVSDLSPLEFGRGYWINITATRPITLQLRGSWPTLEAGATPPKSTSVYHAAYRPPPTTYYGQVGSSANFSPTAGQTVLALVDGFECGQGTTHTYGDTIVYVVAVEAAGPDKTLPCGSHGTQVTFTVNDQAMTPPADWSDAGLQLQNLMPAASNSLKRSI